MRKASWWPRNASATGAGCLRRASPTPTSVQRMLRPSHPELQKGRPRSGLNTRRTRSPVERLKIMSAFNPPDRTSMPFSLETTLFQRYCVGGRNGYIHAVVMQTAHGVAAKLLAKEGRRDLPGPAACPGKLSVYVMITSSPVGGDASKTGGDVESRNPVPSRNTLECGGHGTLVHVCGNLDGRNLSVVGNARALQRGHFQNRLFGTTSTSASREFELARLTRLGTRFGGDRVPSRRRS
jgi:hypothetical protein